MSSQYYQGLTNNQTNTIITQGKLSDYYRSFPTALHSNMMCRIIFLYYYIVIIITILLLL